MCHFKEYGSILVGVEGHSPPNLASATMTTIAQKPRKPRNPPYPPERFRLPRFRRRRFPAAWAAVATVSSTVPPGLLDQLPRLQWQRWQATQVRSRRRRQTCFTLYARELPQHQFPYRDKVSRTNEFYRASTILPTSALDATEYSLFAGKGQIR